MRYIKINKYIMKIELCDDSISDEDRNNIVNRLFAQYNTNKFKILEIEDMVTNELYNNVMNYKINDIIYRNINYYFSKERAFYELDYDFFTYSYEPLDKLYYLFYFNNQYTGIHKVWFDSGQLKEEFYHINGILEGTYTEYNENGMLINQYMLVNGKII
jgi:antitoxin component YwqK of YwqJK toxin-antitoxin module